MALGSYHTLGRSGLRVSPLTLGTMTFGETEWGADREASLAMFDRYLEMGGNFVDTADIYGGSRSEELVGEFLALRRARDQVVLSTKFSLGVRPGDPNSGGNGRKNMARALDGSLRRLGTDFIDLYIVHMWDRFTPVDEVMRSLDDAVTAGKVRYVALSDTPAWYAASAQTLARLRGWEPLAALQLEYSLLERGIEYEFPALCEQLGMSLMVWGPLANGLLSGKYRPTVQFDASKPGRLNLVGTHAPLETIKINDRTWAILSELETVAKELGRPMAQVALNWVANRPAVGTVILGATRLDQLEDNLQALDFTVPPELADRLEEVSKPPRAVPYAFIDRREAAMNAGVVDKRPGFYSRDGELMKGRSDG
jgi:aryl-alcohol dehydrogenase-like predicted oxidoreductase